MADSQTDSKLFSVRIVSVDYYMTAPLPGFDICYSSFQGGRVNEVPVIRVYGATPAGQKTCLHLRGALPYFYVPCSELFLQSDEKGSECTNALALALEKVLKLKGNAGSKRQHVHGCSLVRARKFYGYHSSEELFLKIYLYHPQDVSRAANLLLGGAVLDKSLQPHESHIPFLLQFLVDYNLYGMGHLHISKMKFRNPIPDTFSPRKANYVDRRRPSDMSTSTTAEFQVDLDGEACLDMPIWISSTIPDNWMWKYSSQADPSTDPDIPNIKRQSISELEGDASVDAIMNQKWISYMSLSQTCSQEKMVQSLIPIWEEEFARNGVHEVGLPPDPGKPLRDDVLRTLSHEIGYEEILMELSNDVKVSSDMLQLINSSLNDGNIANIGHCGSLNSIREPSRCPKEGLFQDHVLKKRVETYACPKQLLADQLEATVSMAASQDVKASDQDTLRLLNWLASSQAAEDIDSDDDLARETILSPLMPATTIDTVLEKANVAYENESQKECEDILDSVHDCYFEELDRKTSQSSSNDHSCRSSSSMMIPQLDGSNDDQSPIYFVNESSETHKKPGTSSQADSWNKATLATSNKHKKEKPRWCSLPIALGQNQNDSHPNPVNTPSSHICDERDGGGTSSHMNFNKYQVESSMIVECSTRDLMRVKRSYQAEPSEYGNQVKKVQLGAKGKEDSFLYSESSHDEKEKMPRDSLISRSAITDQPRECHERNSCLALQMQVEPGDIKADKSHSPSYGKLPLLSSSMLKNASKDGVFLSSEGHHVEVGSRASAGLQNYGTSGASTSQGTKDLFQLPDVENQKSAVYMGSCGCCSCENVDSCVKCTKISNPDLCTSVVAPYSQFTSETEEKFPGCGKLLQKNAVGLSQSPAGPSHSISSVTGVSGDVLELKGMTFIKKPPKVEFTDEPRLNAQSACGTPSNHVNKKNKTRTCDQDRGLDKCPPFFEGNFLVGEKISSANCGTSNYVHCQDNLLGVPVHYKNDGSYLYMLTPVYSPPRSESVRRWLSLDCVDSSKMNVVSGPPVYPSTKVCSHDLAESQGSQSTFGVQMNPVVPDARIKQRDEGIILKCEPSMRGSQDFSQISGPDRKSRLTPLSQTGFRHPASIGVGQQLTILSIEVQAESRGDLRPDPRFDAVRIVVLVFQEDDDFRSDTHVLLHCNGESVQRDLDGVSECKVLTFCEERQVFFHFIKMINSFDPDIFMGWDIQGGSLGFLAERAAYLGIGLLNKISRTPSEGNIASRDSERGKLSDFFSEAVAADPMFHEDAAIIDDEWGRTHASGVHVGGRIVLNVWRLMRGEVKLNLYTLEAVAEAVLRRKFPYIPNKVLTNWFLSGPGRARYRCIEYFLERAKLNLQIMNQLDVVNRTSELARIFGIDFFSVLSRGSQYRVESMFLRLAHAQNYVAISPGNQQVASQPAMECIPLVMEPKSGFYADPVVVLDFQSLYPSMIIAYNLCFCTCLGKVTSTKANILGVSSYSPDKNVMHNINDEILLTPNGVMYVPPKVRKGVLPRLLEEILDTRIMVKTAMKKLAPGQQVLHRIFNARQLALKLIANVTYGYTAAGFSGRMPCAELADSIVQCARRTLESAISFVNTNHRWNAKVIYGDTDSMFVLLEGRSIEEAFRIGHEIASEVTAMNPNPVTLKMEKVYHSCFLLTKKRYVGYSYENVDQSKPVFDAKGIETVRRDTCGAVSKIMERSLRIFFEYRDIEKVKSYLVRQWKKIISGRVSLQDFVFAKEVRLGTYSAQASSLPPAAIVATKAMRVDPRAEPRYAERVPYVVVHGEPGARLADVVVDPLDVLSIDSPYRLNDIYYIKKQIIPALQRVFGLVRVDLNQWFSDMPRPEREAGGKRHLFTANAHRTRIDYYYLSKHCILCGELIQASSYVCQNCSRNEAVVAAALTGRTSVLERNIQRLAAICRHCGGGDWLIESGVKCTSLTCSVFYERRKIQKELRSLSVVTTEAGFYPRCMQFLPFSSFPIQATMVLSLLLLKRLSSFTPKPYLFTLSQTKTFSSFSPSDKPSSLSARMSFVFDQIDAIEKERSEKDQTLQRIRAWRESKKGNQTQTQTQTQDLVGSSSGFSDVGSSEMELESRKNDGFDGGGGLMSKKVELVHPWPEWIELMERLVQQNYFDHKRKDEEKMIEDLGFNLAGVAEDEGFDFTRDWKTVQTALLNFGKDRFDILRSLSRQDLQILVGYGCPSTDKKVVFSAKLLRKHVHLDEGDVCSSCNLRSSCERAYLLTNKEDEARTMDAMRVLLTYGFDAINGSVVNESLMKKKSVKTVVRKLLHEVVKLSAVPIDPNLPPPVFKKPPPKVKQPPPPPRKRVGRDDIEMKKGDWLCPKCDFMNFAKNTICLQCDANRPKRQLLPGEWECSQCNFLNYRRNVVCFHCECKRPADDYMAAQQQERQQGSKTQMDKISRRQDVSNAWNFDFDDDESDGADVAAFETADSQKLDEDFPLDSQERRDTSRTNEDGFHKSSRPPKGYETEYPAPGKPGVGFNDFDDEEDDVDSYEIDSNGANRSSRIDFSDIEDNSESEDIDSVDDTLLVGRRNSSISTDAHFRPRRQKGAFRGSEDAEVDFDTDDELPIKTNMKSSQVSYSKPRSRNKGAKSFDSDDDYGLSSDSDDRDFTSQQNKGNKWGSRKDFGRRRSSYSEDEPFSDSESNKGRSFHKNKQRGGKTGQNGRWDSSEGRGDRIRDKRTSFRDNMKRSPRDSRGSSRRSQDNGYNDYRSRGREESYKQQRGRKINYGDQSDSYLDDERHRRPRINVR
ncbi:DNA polymerase zeta catalytic subunit [Solanum dulcamara]|uniref:DNA polymerase zeta catalytic subunit n=1 Tax=Solanum dulcamara TaxID=45834 RepID=UPI00248630F5|nr:DNA polymerase zeta catalytic subunit [Solanum dulcamara]